MREHVGHFHLGQCLVDFGKASMRLGYVNLDAFVDALAAWLVLLHQDIYKLDALCRRKIGGYKLHQPGESLTRQVSLPGLPTRVGFSGVALGRIAMDAPVILKQ
ncbi:hypothetical protein D9M68_959840 [compost metagenome]